MAEVTEANADPSMEEILASIRKIISDETPPVEVAPEPPLPPPEPEPEPAEEVLELTDMVAEEPASPPPVQEPVRLAPVPAVPETGEPLISGSVASTAASKLSSLANTIEIERLSSGPMTATFLGNGHRTLEDMVIELMRPLLKDWLDQNLPAVVERLVQKEIERIARRS